MPDSVERFRKLTGRSRRSRIKVERPKVPPREWALAGLLLLNVLWLSFAYGGVVFWGEVTGVLLAASTLLLLPQWTGGELRGSQSPVFRLLKLPLFWIGFGLYLWFFIQTWNHSWEYTLYPHGKPRLVRQDPAIPWLPTGVMTLLDQTNPFRAMTFYAIPWLACSAAWAGLTTRRSVGLLLHGLALCGVAFAVVALQQHFTGADRILGILETTSGKADKEIPFWGTLINENHAAFYLILANALCLGLFLSGWHKDRQDFRRHGGAWLLYLGLSILVTFAVLMAQARGAIIFIALQWLVFLAVCSIFLIRTFGMRGAIFPGTVAVLIAGLVITFIINPTVFENQREDWLMTYDLVENPQMEARYYMGQIAWDMIEDRPWLGHGAGSWMYLHLPYLKDYPEFQTKRDYWRKNVETGKYDKRIRVTWYREAHVDLLQYLVEWGIFGCLFPLMAILWLLYRALRAIGAWDPGTVIMLSGIFIVWLGAIVEFHFRIPLVLTAWCLALTATVKFTDLQAR